MRSARRATSIGVACLATALAAAAESPSSDACNTAYVETQRLRRAGKLRSAERQALACAQDQCSVTVRRDCSTWLEHITEAMPRLVVEAHDQAGNELLDVRVYSGAELLAERLDGKARAIDPGLHELRFEHAGQVETRRLVAHEGQVYRRVSVVFTHAPPVPPPSAQAALPLPGRMPIESPRPEPVQSARPIPVSSLVFAGVGATSLAAFGVLASSAYLSERDARRECQRQCDARAVESVHQRYLMADVALGFGISSLVAAGTLWAFTPPSPEPSALRVDVRGSQLTLEGSF